MDPNHRPLIGKGPKQVGKTESILRFARANYENVVYINFVEEPKYKLICEDGYQPDLIIRDFTRMDPSKHFQAKSTVIVFDETQMFPDISTSRELPPLTELPKRSGL